jgi:hypothetical protein
LAQNRRSNVTAKRPLARDDFKKWKSGDDAPNIEAQQEQRNQSIAQGERNPIHTERSGQFTQAGSSAQSPDLQSRYTTRDQESSFGKHIPTNMSQPAMSAEHERQMDMARAGKSPDEIPPLPAQDQGEEHLRDCLAQCDCSPEQIEQICNVMYPQGEDLGLPNSHEPDSDHHTNPTTQAHPPDNSTPFDLYHNKGAYSPTSERIKSPSNAGAKDEPPDLPGGGRPTPGGKLTRFAHLTGDKKLPTVETFSMGSHDRNPNSMQDYINRVYANALAKDAMRKVDKRGHNPSHPPHEPFLHAAYLRIGRA